jgi:hypothetical protein
MCVEDGENAVDRAVLLLKRRWVSVSSLGLGIGLNLGNDIGLVDSALDDLLLFRRQVFGKVLVEGRLFLLEA